ncbi:MAG: hypothetical protein ACP5MD_10105 [Verrucomicrobiia bacterium]
MSDCQVRAIEAGARAGVGLMRARTPGLQVPLLFPTCWQERGDSSPPHPVNVLAQICVIETGRTIGARVDADETPAREQSGAGPHFFISEGGGNDSRRCFNALSDIGRVIFVRAAKWAMGEEPRPYVPLGIKDVSVVGQSRIKVTWQGSAEKNYKIVGTTDLFGPTDFTNWQTIVQDIPGVDGEISRTLDISGAPKIAYLRIRAAP